MGAGAEGRPARAEPIEVDGILIGEPEGAGCDAVVGRVALN
ncbi:MAG: hypothetical protein ACTHN0_03290 [Aquihabitans sp.]